MKQIFVLFVMAVALLLPLHSQAQLSDLADRAYTTVTIGANSYINDANAPFKYMGYEGEIGLGLNLFDNVGARIQGMFLHNANTEEIKSNYLSFHADLTFDVLNLLAGKDPMRKHGLKFIIGMGYVQRQPNYLEVADNEVTLIPGFSYTYPILNGIYFTAEAKSYLFLPKFDFNKMSSALVIVSAGIQHRFNDNPYRNGVGGGADKVHENWFAQIGGGINSLSYIGLQSSDRTRLMKPAIELMVGKYLSPVMGMRLGVLGISAATHVSSFNIASVHGDILFNIKNMVYPRQNRPFNLSLCIGAGMINRMDSHTMTLCANAGVQGRVWLSTRSDIIGEVRYNMTTSNFVHDVSGQSQTSVGMITAMLGYVFNITNGSMR
ncbi:MAG: hypothetical protein KBT04_04360 [Bacteroidales bacterium]|nr:hypothetical protein [Candidatus Colimorpha onthohippi]